MSSRLNPSGLMFVWVAIGSLWTLPPGPSISRGNERGVKEMSDILQKLNPAQREVVTATEGFIRIIAGVGSGKTRALFHRFAYLVTSLSSCPAASCASLSSTRPPARCASRFTPSPGTMTQAMSTPSTASASPSCRRTTTPSSTPSGS